MQFEIPSNLLNAGSVAEDAAGEAELLDPVDQVPCIRVGIYFWGSAEFRDLVSSFLITVSIPFVVFQFKALLRAKTLRLGETAEAGFFAAFQPVQSNDKNLGMYMFVRQDDEEVSGYHVATEPECSGEWSGEWSGYLNQFIQVELQVRQVHHCFRLNPPAQVIGITMVPWSHTQCPRTAYAHALS